MTILNPGATKASDTGLAEMEKAARLRDLAVWRCPVRAGAGKTIQKMTQLEFLRLHKGQLPADELDELQKALPKLKIDP